jgi:hypothetical protein
MWFWRVNETTELASGMSAPEFRDESLWGRGSELVQDSSCSCLLSPTIFIWVFSILLRVQLSFLHIPSTQHFLYIILYWKRCFLLRHVFVQSNNLQGVYIWFYENYYTYNESVFFNGFDDLLMTQDVIAYLGCLLLTPEVHILQTEDCWCKLCVVLYTILCIFLFDLTIICSCTYVYYLRNSHKCRCLITSMSSVVCKNCIIIYYSLFIAFVSPIAVAARSKARTVFARSNTEIVGSNSTGGMDVCVCSVCVYSVSTVSSETASRPNKRLMRTYHWISLFKSYIQSAN